MICIHTLEYRDKNTVYIEYSVKFSEPKTYTYKVPTYNDIRYPYLELSFHRTEWMINAVSNYLLHS